MEHTAFCAEEYDEKIRQTLPFYEEFYEQVIDVLDISGKKNVSWLDVGCGTGKMNEAARKRISIQEFVFTDISEKMLAVVKKRFQTGENRFRQMSVLELEDTEKYDVVTAIQVHHYLSEKDRRIALERCCRALKAGGIFSIDDRGAFGTYAGVWISGSRVDLDVLYAGWVYGGKTVKSITAARELFLSKGYEETAITDIMELAGGAKGMFYRFFQSKEEVMHAFGDQMFLENNPFEADRRNIMVALDTLAGMSVLCAAVFLSGWNAIVVIGVLLVVLSVLLIPSGIMVCVVGLLATGFFGKPDER